MRQVTPCFFSHHPCWRVVNFIADYPYVNVKTDVFYDICARSTCVKCGKAVTSAHYRSGVSTWSLKLSSIDGSDGKRGTGFNQCNLRSVLARFVTGQGWTQYSVEHRVSGQTHMCQSSYYNAARAIYSAIESESTTVFELETKRMLANNSKLVMCFDGSWAHPGWHSSQACFIVLNANTKKIAMCEVLERDRFAWREQVKIWNARLSGGF